MTSDHIWGCSWGHLWLILLKFSDNVGMMLFFFWCSLKKKLRSTSSPENSSFKVSENLLRTLYFGQKSKHRTSKVTFLCQKIYESFWFSFSNNNSEEHFCFHHSLTIISHVRIFFSWQFTFPNFYLDFYFPILFRLWFPFSI